LNGAEEIADTMKNAWISLATVCALVLGVYAYMAQSPPWEPWESLSPNATNTYYNLLVQGFRAGQLNLKKDVPPGFMKLANPYDPTANTLYRDPPYRMHDLSYYKGKLFLYFGVTPALVLFWPFAALTGRYLLHRQAVTIFCAIGFLASVGSLGAVWRRYFAEVSIGVVMACTLALGLATGAPVLLSWAGVYEVPISCGYAFTMLALAAIWCALRESRNRSGWLATASVAYGLAVGSRPSLLFGAVILLVPLLQSRRERRKIGAQLVAAMIPITLIGLGLMLYNDLRFGSPFEFGLRYQLGGPAQFTLRFFSLQYLWFNFRVYFLESAHWGARFPFVHPIAVPPLPAGYTQAGSIFGIVTNIPLVWLALAASLTWRNRPAEVASILRWFVMAVALAFGVCALTLALFCGANFRYEMDFLPALLLLAAIGILGLERSLANRPTVWRWAVRGGWGALLAFSVAFNLLASVDHYTDAQNSLGSELFKAGKTTEAIGHYQQAVRLRPEYAEAHYNLGVAFAQLGRLPEAIDQYQQALQLKPDYAEARNNLGVAFERTGRFQEAIDQYQQALRFGTDNAEVRNNLGVALMQSGNLPGAIKEYEHALQLKPDDIETYNNLGTVAMQSGDLPGAIKNYEQALRIKPDYAEAHYNLGVAYVQLNRMPDAVDQWQQTLRIKPEHAEALNNLGAALGQAGKLREAAEECEHALRIKPNYAQAHFNLASILESAGNVPEAINEYQQALRLKPDLAEARDAIARLQARP
jgi:tetratricopeptide (TPR) repeat protein